MHFTILHFFLIYGNIMPRDERGDHPMKKFMFYNHEDGNCYYVVAQKIEYAYDIMCDYFGTEYFACSFTYEGKIDR